MIRFTAYHGLCVCLNNVAKGLDPVTYAKYAQMPLRAGLVLFDCPKFLAEIFSAASAFDMKQILDTLPHAQMHKMLRVLIPLVCSDLDVCPVRQDVVKTYASPILLRSSKNSSPLSAEPGAVSRPRVAEMSATAAPGGPADVDQGGRGRQERARCTMRRKPVINAFANAFCDCGPGAESY